MTKEIKFQVLKSRVDVPSRMLSTAYVWSLDHKAAQSLHKNWYRITQDNKEMLNNFPRVYNRKKIHSVPDFVNAGYPYVNLSDELMDNYHSIKAWCVEQYGKNKTVFFGYNAIIVFENEGDKTLFALRWL